MDAAAGGCCYTSAAAGRTQRGGRHHAQQPASLKRRPIKHFRSTRLGATFFDKHAKRGVTNIKSHPTQPKHFCGPCEFFPFWRDMQWAARVLVAIVAVAVRRSSGPPRVLLIIMWCVAADWTTRMDAIGLCYQSTHTILFYIPTGAREDVSTGGQTKRTRAPSSAGTAKGKRRRSIEADVRQQLNFSSSSSPQTAGMEAAEAARSNAQGQGRLRRRQRRDVVVAAAFGLMGTYVGRSWTNRFG